MSRRQGTLVLSLLILGMTSACLPKSKPQTLERPGGEEMTVRDARVALYEVTNRLVGRVEAVSDEVYRTTDDATVRRDAMLLKTEVIPAMQRAAFRTDPLLAVADLWLLLAQVQDWLEIGPGRERFGAHRPLVLAAFDEMEQEFRATLIRYGGPSENERNRQIIHQYAKEHPIGSNLAIRPGAAEALGNRLERGGIGALAAAGALVEDFEDLSERLAIYGAQLPKHARWQAELMLDERGLGYVDAESWTRSFEQLGATAVRLDRFVDEVPALIDGKVDAVWPRLEATIAGLDLAPYEAVADRVIDRQMEVALAAISAERLAALEAVSREREIAVAEAEQAANRVVERALDQAFERAGSLLGLPLGATVVLGLALLAGPFALGLVAGAWLRGRRGA